MISRLWAEQVIKGNKTFDDVPNKLKPSVEKILITEGYLNLVCKKEK